MAEGHIECIFAAKMISILVTVPSLQILIITGCVNIMNHGSVERTGNKGIEMKSDPCLYCGHSYDSHEAAIHKEEGFPDEGCNDVWCCCTCSGPALHQNNDGCYCTEYRPMMESVNDTIEMLQSRIAVYQGSLQDRGNKIVELAEHIKELEENKNDISRFL